MTTDALPAAAACNASRNDASALNLITQAIQLSGDKQNAARFNDGNQGKAFAVGPLRSGR